VLEGRGIVSAKSETGASTGGQLRLLIGIAVSLGSVVLVVRGIEWDAFWAALQGAEYWWLLPSLLSLALAVGVKVLKWQLLLAPAGKTSKTNLFYSISIGYLISDVLPGRLGELARVYTESRLDKVSPVAVLASVAADRILDVVACALLLAISLPTADLPPWVAESGLVVGVGAIVLLALCILLAYPVGRNLFLHLLAISPRFPGKALIEKWAEALCLGMQGLRGKGAQLRIGSATVVVWLLTCLFNYFGLLAFHIQAPIWAAILVLALTNLGMVVPSSPGYIGVFHYLVVLALGAFGVPRELALGYAIVMHLLGFVPVGLLGAFSLWRCGLTLMDWRGAAGATESGKG
jgi:uncharacterized membrane protein YbhN (UPF0104 family)